MEGKEVRFGIAQIGAVGHGDDSSLERQRQLDARFLHAAGRTRANVAHELGEVVFGGVGSGLYGMLAYAIIAVFIAGLMVGRRPNTWAKKSKPSK